jgi:hypothetical protein
MYLTLIPLIKFIFNKTGLSLNQNVNKKFIPTWCPFIHNDQKHYFHNNVTGSVRKHANKQTNTHTHTHTHLQKITEMPHIRNQHLATLSNQSNKVVNFNLFKWYRECVHEEKHHFQHLL